MLLKTSQRLEGAVKENVVFLRRWIKHPFRLGAIMPSSSSLVKAISTHVELKDSEFVLELGAGTGRLTRALLDRGIAKAQLYVVEIDPVLCTFLQNSHVGVNVIQGDAANLAELLPPEILGNVAMIVSGIPMMSLPASKCQAIIESCFSVMKTGGSLIQFTYGPTSPLPAKKMGLLKQKVGRIYRNFPPAAIWKYSKI